MSLIVLGLYTETNTDEWLSPFLRINKFDVSEHYGNGDFKSSLLGCNMVGTLRGLALTRLIDSGVSIKKTRGKYRVFNESFLGLDSAICFALNQLTPLEKT